MKEEDAKVPVKLEDFYESLSFERKRLLINRLKRLAIPRIFTTPSQAELKELLDEAIDSQEGEILDTAYRDRMAEHYTALEVLREARETWENLYHQLYRAKRVGAEDSTGRRRKTLEQERTVSRLEQELAAAREALDEASLAEVRARPHQPRIHIEAHRFSPIGFLGRRAR